MKKISFRKYLVIGVIILFVGTSIVPTLAQPLDKYYATADIPVLSSEVINDYTYTVDSDNQYEAITEAPMGKGKPINRYHALEHKWTIEVSEEYDCYVFYIEAYRTPGVNSDDFVFAYSLDDETYTNMLTVTKTADDDVCQKSFPLSDTLSGTVYVRVRDTLRGSHEAPWNDDTIYIDRMYFAADTTPPVILHVDSTTHDNTWYNPAPAESPPGRWDHTMVYDVSVDQTVMFGGRDIEGYFNDTWIYDHESNTWTNADPSVSPPTGTLTPRTRHAMAYDAGAGVTIMFGGGDETGRLNETWAYSSTDNIWYDMSPTMTIEPEDATLAPRVAAAMAYDPAAGGVIMFGGTDDAGWLNETWVYDYGQNTWSKLTPEVDGGVLTPRAYHAMAYDPAAGGVIMFGGTDDAGWLNETWVYDAPEIRWSKMTPTVVPEGQLTPRVRPGMVYDSTAEMIVLFGGMIREDGAQIEVNDTWTYEYAVTGGTWCRADPAILCQALSPRESHGMVYDVCADRTIVFGGFDGAGPELDDTWIYALSDSIAGITWSTDELSDGLVGYWPEGDAGAIVTVSDATLVTSHCIVLTDVSAETTYEFYVESTDPSGNTAIDDNNGFYYTFPDTIAPVINDVATTGITHSDAAITWNTDENSNSIVNYGTTTVLGSTASDTAMVTSHSVTLTGLSAEIIYYYEVQSTDASGNTATDDNSGSYYTFTTTSIPSNVMHIYSIDMWYVVVKNKFDIYSKVKIVDAGDNAVEGATVYVDFLLATGTTLPMSDVTDSNGEVTFYYGPTPKSGTYATTVTDVVKSDWVYNSGDNVETTESLVVP